MFFRGSTVVAHPDRCPSCDARFPVVLPVGCLRSSRNNPMITCRCGLEVELFLYPLRATDTGKDRMTSKHRRLIDLSNLIKNNQYEGGLLCPF